MRPWLGAGSSEEGRKMEEERKLQRERGQKDKS